MRITGLPPIAPRDLKAARSAGGFTVPEQAESAPQASRPGAPATSVAMLVALSEADEERERRRKMAEQAEAGLDALEQLDAEGETASPEKLEALATWSESAAAPADPALAAIQRQIELRVQVELAKRRR